MPDLSGDFTLDTKTLHAFRGETLGKDPLVIPRGACVRHAPVGRRLIAHGGREPAKAGWVACELHQSGVGAFAAKVANHSDLARPGQVDENTTASRIEDEHLVLGSWFGLRLLARRARDRAAGGSATVRATIVPVTPDLPAELHHPRGFGGTLGTHQVTEPPWATSLFDVDDLAEDGPALIAATSVLAVGLIQHFGYPETLQMTTDGLVRSQWWSSQLYGRHVQEWATKAKVDATQDTIG
ncbi:hypothetical protein [Streptomyces sp. NPDC020362]|uniref:hypothetical protein n=1 Tax=Streptomyces sp. NPDC020362 TaxID=3154486 RepID=UPI00340650E4